MATTTNAINSIRCTVCLRGTVLSVTNNKTVRIDLARAKGNVTGEEETLLERLTSGLPQGVNDPVDLTTGEMVSLKSLSDRYGPDYPPLPAPTSQTARPRPVPVASPTQERTAGTVVNRTTHRTMLNVKGTGGEADYAEARVEQLSRVAEDMETRSFHLFFYDIKDEQTGTCPNPSWRANIRTGEVDSRGREVRWMWPGMWRMGFRLNLSCWVVDSSILPGGESENPALARLCRHWEANGVNFHAIRFHETELDRIRDLARKALDEELIRLHTSLLERLDKADKALAAAQEGMSERTRQGEDITHNEREKVCAARDNAVRNIIREAQDRLATCLEFAERFDDTMLTSDLFSAYRAAIEAHRTAFNARMIRDGRPVRLHVE